MSIHDWTRVSPGTFHDFHTSWIAEIKRALNGGILPQAYYALAEQIAGQAGPDVLTLHATPHGTTPSPSSRPEGALAVAEAPPQVSVVSTPSEETWYVHRRRTLVIRHSSGDEVVALIEILSPGNKSSRRELDRFLDKAIAALQQGYHLLVVDLFPPGPHDPEGIHGAFWAQLGMLDYRQPHELPLTLISYVAGEVPTAYVEPTAVGTPLPSMPLFLHPDWYVEVPLESTYADAYASVPLRWREVIEA